MKTGRSLTELAQEIERQSQSKRDFIAPTDKIDVGLNKAEAPSLIIDGEYFPINTVAAGQIASHTGIPKAYWNRMHEAAPDLLIDNVHRWFNEEPAARLIRTLDGSNRAFLSDRYRPLENYQFAEAVLPTLQEHNLEIMSCEITERRLYIKAVHPKINRDIPKGHRLGDGTHTIFDTLAPAIIVSNSEVGCGALSIQHGVFTKACTNLMAIADSGMKKTHLGARHELTNNFERALTDETRAATDRALWLQARDVVAAAFDEAEFLATTEKLAGAVNDRIEGDPVRAVEFGAKRLGMTQQEGKGVLRHLIEGGDLSRYGFLNAVTRTAQDLESYDRATEFEAMGGKVLELPKAQWREIAEAA